MAQVNAAREILRRLHDVMAGKAAAQVKLNQVVKLVAAELGSEVASIYLLRDGVLAWGLAGAAGAALTVVWNYAVSATLVWRAK